MNRKCTFYLVGFGLGSLTGLLLAPKTGASTRAGLAKSAKRGQRLVKQRVASVGTAVNRNVGRGVARMVRTAKSMSVSSPRAFAHFR